MKDTNVSGIILIDEEGAFNFVYNREEKVEECVAIGVKAMIEGSLILSEYYTKVAQEKEYLIAARASQGFMHVASLFVDEGVENGNVNHSIMGESSLTKIGAEYIFYSDLFWRRLIRTMLEQSLVALRSSQVFILL